MTAPAPQISPLVFERRPDGYTAALLGLSPVGLIEPYSDPGDPRMRFKFTLKIPPMERSMLVRSRMAAKLRMHAYARRWLKIAGLHEPQVG